MYPSHLTIASLSLFSSLVVGCAAAPADESESTEAALAAKSSFKLYADPDHVPNADCDVYTLLNLSAPSHGGVRNPIPERGIVVAHFRDVSEGTCRIRLDAVPRSYRLVLEDTDCGSHVYRSEEVVEGQKRAVTITDHRTRTCRDLVPAQIIVEESDEGGTHTLYSFDGR
jgi:hypothetical protein